MKRIGLSGVLAVACLQAIFLLGGCGGGTAGSGTPPPPTGPSISSFTPGAATIEATTSTTLTATFSNGTGVITPGNISVTSGTAVTVSPASTTTYTLTVTGTSGTTPATLSTTVTVDPVPTIASFAPGSGSVASGASIQFTATFAGGSGAITGAGITSPVVVTSGTAVNVTAPTVTSITQETYTLTVTPPVGTAITQTATVTVNPASPAPTISAFGAGAATIEAGSSTTLTATFANGTGIITPGNLTITSGGSVTISPTSTTTYTLTVTGASGTTPAIQTATVTVDPVPTVTSFTANPTNVTTAGGSSTLTAVFSGGTGVITAPGGFSQSATSGVGVTVNPAASTTYTLTVTPPVGSVNATQTVTVTVGTATISSFNANPTTIESGSSTNLIGVFSGGTGAITGPGIATSLTATSGAAVPVTPSATTTQTTDTYTLTVTPTGGGTAATQTVNVTVDPAPSITSFSASPSTITAGGSGTQLTAVFSGGAGVVTPGNITMTSGTAVTVNPTANTTYTLTVTPTLGSAITQQATVTVNTGVTINQGTFGATVTSQILGMNLAVWYDDPANASSIVTAFKRAGIAALRWPGGSTSDDYHWNGNNAYPTGAPNPGTCNGAYQNSDTNYLNFIDDIENAIPSGYDIALTADYGTNPACTGGGDPNEAANWVKYAYANGGTVSHVTVGNEEYGSWETDMHSAKNNPTTYATAVTGPSGYYDLIKAQSASTLVGVDVDAGTIQAGWDSTVLANAKNYYDFVEFHFYPQNPGGESDTFLVQQAAQQFTADITTLKSELTTAGEPNTPIYVGEIGSASSNPGKQTWSITQGLYAGQILGEAMNDGVSRVTWWIGFGNCNGNNGNMSSSLYGWQNFGAYNVFADGSGDTGGTNNSACNYGGPIGTMSPTAQAFNLFQNVAVTGEHALTASVAGDTTDVRAYAATHSGGTALVLFNLNETATANVVVGLSGQTNSSDVSVETYDKALYDQTNSATPVWAAPTTTDMGSQTFPLTLTLQPWSMNVVIVK